MRTSSICTASLAVVMLITTANAGITKRRAKIAHRNDDFVTAYVAVARTTVMATSPAMKGGEPAAILNCGQSVSVVVGTGRWLRFRYPLTSSDGIGLIRRQDIAPERPDFDTCARFKLWPGATALRAASKPLG